MFHKRKGHKYTQEKFEMLDSSKKVMKLFLKILAIILSILIGKFAISGFRFNSFQGLDFSNVPYMTQKLTLPNSSESLDLSNPSATEKTVTSLLRPLYGL